jgi:hypothetical protein
MKVLNHPRNYFMGGDVAREAGIRHCHAPPTSQKCLNLVAVLYYSVTDDQYDSSTSKLPVAVLDRLILPVGTPTMFKHRHSS